MSLLLHLSDPHFGSEQPQVIDALLRLAHARRPALAVLSGDITQRARPAQFAAARRFCDALDVQPLLALPGNHDIALFNLGKRLLRPYADYLGQFGPQLEPVLDEAHWLVVGVNTTRASRHKNGVVSPAQVAQVAGRLAQARPGQLRIVVTHQPADVLRPQDRHDRLRGAEPALQAWSAAGADLVLGGHIHLPYVLDLVARPQPTPRPMWCVQAGTAVSDRVRHGTCNSVNLIHWEPLPPGQPRVCRVERCDYHRQRGAFETAQVTELLLG
jgi:3',5'-cyclic AMP phosphodiesterase CpdA